MFFEGSGTQVENAASKTTRAKRKPVGLVLVIGYTLIHGVGLLLLAGAVFSPWTVQNLHPPLAGVGLLVAMVLAILHVPVIYGLWAVRKWGRALAVGLYAVMTPFDVILVFFGFILGAIGFVSYYEAHPPSTTQRWLHAVLGISLVLLPLVLDIVSLRFLSCRRCRRTFADLGKRAPGKPKA